MNGALIKARPHITAMAAYGLAHIEFPPGLQPVLLNQNESASPPSPRVIEAMIDAAQTARLYSDPAWIELRAAIAEVHALDADHLLVGAGSMELIGAAIAAFAGPGEQVLSTAHGYAFFRTATMLAEAAYDAAPETDRVVSVDALMAAVTPTTRIVCVANPGNPTGTRISRANLVRLREGLPENVLLIIDEAYAEFADHLGESLFDLVERGNTVVLRTFSKAYGLAGLRVGWGLFPPAVRREVHKRINPNNVSGVSQAAATAAARDQAYMRDAVDKTAARRDAFAERCAGIGLPSPASFTNFVLLDFGAPEHAVSAHEDLRQRGIAFRPMGFYGLGNCLRVTVGSDDEMTAAFDVLRAWKDREG